LEKEHSLKQPCWQNWTTMCRKMKVDLHLSPCTKINTQWIKYFNVSFEIMKTTEKLLEETLQDIDIGSIFLRHLQKHGQQSKNRKNITSN
jgi:hypothetical protein